METWMKFLERPVTTLKDKLKDSQRLGRWDRLEVNDPKTPPTTLSFHLCHMETKQNTFGDRQRP